MFGARQIGAIHTFITLIRRNSIVPIRYTAALYLCVAPHRPRDKSQCQLLIHAFASVLCERRTGVPSVSHLYKGIEGHCLMNYKSYMKYDRTGFLS